VIKLSLKEKIVATMIVVFLLVSTIGILSMENADEKNTKIILGHLFKINMDRPGRGSLNYDLYIKENNEHYKISANWADCFQYNDFVNEVKENQLIQIRIMKHNDFITNSDLRLVVALASNGQQYLNADCVNDSLQENKRLVPFFWLAAIIGAVIFWFTKKRKFNKDSVHE